MPCGLGGEEGKNFVRGEAPVVLVGALHGLRVGARLNNREWSG
jgi:hypothetical protein